MKKLITTILTSIILTAAATALPGFTSFIPDGAGEYVYYRDNSFERESYIGLLSYDSETYEIKYYSPKNEQNQEAEKNLALLIKINPDADFFDMVGERIITSINYNSDDVDILNYLHDFLYELSAKRISKDSVTTREETATEELALFGGEVTFVYNCLIPFFNVHAILDQEGKKILECCTIGQISSSEDNSFEDFKGIHTIPLNTAQNSKSKSKAKKAKAAKFNFNNQTIVLDKDWNQQMENVWTLGEDSVVTVSEIPATNEDQALNENFILRKLIESTQGRYTDFSNTEIIQNKKNNQYKITSISHTSEQKDPIRAVKIITQDKEKFDYFSISTFCAAYEKNPAYFDKIATKYSVK